jgi:ABC-2 type transport system ATP-binding protein
MTSAAVYAESLQFRYGSRQALIDVSFAVPEGCVFGLLGPNGSGKTTLFRLLSTLIPMQQGRLEVCGLDVSMSQSDVRRQLGVTFQSPALDVRLTVIENLRCHGSLYGMSGSSLHAKIQEMLERFQLTDRATTLVSQLSGGLKRRVELAKGLMHSPKVLLLDEPTSGLDPRGRQEFWTLLLGQAKASGATVIVATHLMTEAELCDQLLLLDQGRNVASGSPLELQSQLSGERLSLRMRDAAQSQSAIETLLNATSTLHGHQLTLRVANPADQIGPLISAFRDQIISLELTRPTLEDVFMELTGRSLIESGDKNE